MTEDTKEVEYANPLDKAVANGFVEPDPPTREERIKAVITAVDHAMTHNAPMSIHTAAEIKALLGVEEASVQSGPDDSGDANAV
jgi:hypothetical protein